MVLHSANSHNRWLALRWATVAIVCAFCALGSHEVRAQLISPGKLTTAHADLEGITNCTNCHALGKRGIDAGRCLDCHTPLAARIESGRGYHGGLEPGTCGTCHKEHYGRSFDIVKLDTTKFDHGDTGFTLLASHERASCGSCHVPDNIVDNDVLRFKGTHGAVDGTYLGLATACNVCHGGDSPHGNQFGVQGCNDCHDEGDWEHPPYFDHAETAFALTGRHVEVTCSDCHESTASTAEVVYSDADASSCTSCHEDVHAGTMGALCTTCHSTAGWDRISQAVVARSFDHDRTGFPLVGRHATASCTSCHAKPAAQTATIAITYTAGTRAATFPHPTVEDCASCHVDYHDGFFAASGQVSCDNCHTEQDWLPSSYDVQRHNVESDFELTGAHLATPCFACHNNPDLGQHKYTFGIGDVNCETCHAADSPHDDDFTDETGLTDCSTCHATSAWPQLTSFDHGRTEFPLTGAHTVATCASCHGNPAAPAEPLSYVETPMLCASCHGEDDPHEAQFGGDGCESCHDTASFRLSPASTRFDHERTRFPLEGAHEDVVCGACHVNEVTPDGRYFTRFRPIPRECRDCHEDTR